MNPQQAEILGLDALAWLAGDPAGLERFLRFSGVEAADLRAAAGSTGLSLGVLDFLLAHEELLLVFCEASGTPPANINRARQALEPEA